MRLRLVSMVWLYALSSLTSCSSERDPREGIDPAPEVAPPETIEGSFAVMGTADAPVIAIRREALDRELLLHASLIEQVATPMWSGLKSRVVAFHLRGDRLYLMEATQGHAYYDDVPQRLILAEFPVLSATDDLVAFDFSAGLSHVFVAGDWYAHDWGGDAYQGTWQAVPTEASYLEAAALGNGELEITQVAQIGGGDRRTVVVKYYLSPYVPAAGFVPSPAADFDRMGFFEVAPVIDADTGRTVVRSSRFDAARPIVFAISASTPPEYRQAVADGILYWNRAFGAEVIQVVDAPAGVTAPSRELNVVQWIDWSSAGFAYADAQMDPRSGEILHAQVYLTSVFAISGLDAARALLRRLEDGAGAAPPHVSLAGWQARPMCAREHDRSFVRSLRTLVALAAPDEVFLRIAQDSVREVVAHEVGHTLGLRHNFAGSLGTSYPLSQRQEIVRRYVEDGVVEHGVVPSTSVMDYHLYEEAAFVGRIISDASQPALAYDAAAIRALYDGEKAARLPLFCTDSHLGEYVDCRQFDTGASVVEFARWDEGEGLATTASRLVERFIAARAPAPGWEPTPLEEVYLSPDGIGSYALWYRGLYAEALADGAKVLRVWRSVPFVNGLNVDAVKAAQRDHVAAEIERMGGLDLLLAPVPPAFLDEVLAEVAVLVASPGYQSGVGAGGQAYQFTEADQATILSIAGQVLGRAQPGLVAAELWGYEAAVGLADDPVADELASLQADRALDILTASDSTETVAITVDDQELTLALPAPRHPKELRVRAAAMVAAERSVAPEWGAGERARVRREYEAFVTGALGRGMDELTVSTLPKAAARWILEAQAVLDELPY